MTILVFVGLYISIGVCSGILVLFVNLGNLHRSPIHNIQTSHSKAILIARNIITTSIISGTLWPLTVVATIGLACISKQRLRAFYIPFA